jgi:hypothetical protein
VQTIDVRPTGLKGRHETILDRGDPPMAASIGATSTPWPGFDGEERGATSDAHQAVDAPAAAAT